MKFILGTKQYMTQIFDDQGTAHSVTAVLAGPVVVTQIKTKEKDGYTAMQVGYGERKLSRVAKAQEGHLKRARHAYRQAGEVRADLKPVRVYREGRISPADAGAVTVGDTITLETFAEGDRIEVAGITKAKGFAGVVKRHGFHGGPRTHGQKHSERSPGSIGAAGVQRVFKGTRMAGRMGGVRTTVKNLTVAKVDVDTNMLYVRGAVPGRRGTLLEIRKF